MLFTQCFAFNIEIDTEQMGVFSWKMISLPCTQPIILSTFKTPSMEFYKEIINFLPSSF
jgi:hypothetical protein